MMAKLQKKLVCPKWYICSSFVYFLFLVILMLNHRSFSNISLCFLRYAECSAITLFHFSWFASDIFSLSSHFPFVSYLSISRPTLSLDMSCAGWYTLTSPFSSPDISLMSPRSMSSYSMFCVMRMGMFVLSFSSRAVYGDSPFSKRLHMPFCTRV